MKTIVINIAYIIFSCMTFLSACDNNTARSEPPAADSTSNISQYDGYSSEIEWGHHLVMICGCNDCHTPKIITARGPVPDTSLLLSGHPANMSVPNIDPKEIESKGLAVTNDMTAWIGPWGISYSANITPSKTGIADWSETQFTRAIREGKWQGLENARQLLPPMPWQDFSFLRDNEVKAIFAYLKSIKPVKNTVPQPVPPVAMH